VEKLDGHTGEKCLVDKTAQRSDGYARFSRLVLVFGRAFNMARAVVCQLSVCLACIVTKRYVVERSATVPLDRVMKSVLAKSLSAAVWPQFVTQTYCLHLLSTCAELPYLSLALVRPYSVLQHVNIVCMGVDCSHLWKIAFTPRPRKSDASFRT